MKTSVGLIHKPFKGGLEALANVFEMGEYKAARIHKTLNSVVTVKGRGNVLLKQLFSPSCRAVVVVRRPDGSRLDPCDFASYLVQTRNSKTRAERQLE